jgi:pentapeptide repeat protein
MELKKDYRGQDLSRKKFYGADFSGQDLSSLRMRSSLFHKCNFDDADMTESDCDGSEFFLSTFRNTRMYRTNMKDAKLAQTVFEPKDCFGMTLTLQCKTFDKMKVSPMWWNIFLMFGSLMLVGSVKENELVQNRLVQAIGPERYVKLRAMLVKREI